MADCDVNKVITIMNDSDQGESMTVQEAPLMGKLTPRLLRTLSSESNLQTLSLGTSSDNDSLATISLAEIGGIPQSGSTTSLDPNLLIGLSPETLNMMTNSFPFLPTTSGTNDLSIGASGGDLPNCSVNDLESLTRHSSDRIAIRTRVSNSLPAQPVMSCLNTIQSGRTSTSKNEKPSLGPAIPLEVDGVCSDSNVVTIINSAIVRNPQGVSGINCARANSDTVTISHGQEIQPKSNQTLNLFDNALETRTDTLHSNSQDSSHVSEGTHEPVTVEAFLNESRPGPSQESMSLTLSRPTSLSIVVRLFPMEVWYRLQSHSQQKTPRGKILYWSPQKTMCNMLA
ncbi:hypothetical protein BSL78_13872 [Apostichopus japonicus]|uniref:Uncharacterized protein n=1 Tax=Stichopus japonicus TaxID=307972 RepID=A0A2G8KMT1_STIJA|nr:hypothetical protein BSL78_13872 [Apostichopus japonicus]